MSEMVDYAKEYGIDLQELKKEHPLHATQLWEASVHQMIAEDYWQWISSVRRAESEAIQRVVEDYQEALAKPAPVRKPAPKRSLSAPKPKPEKLIKVGRHKFSQKQLQIAMDSLEKQSAPNR